MRLTGSTTVPDRSELVPASLMLLELSRDQANCSSGQKGRTRAPIRLQQEILTKIKEKEFNSTYHHLENALAAPADQYQANSARYTNRGNIVPEINVKSIKK